MASLADGEFISVAEEKFDFDISLSPASSKGNEEDDEVFLGPVGHREKCISYGLENHLKESVSSGASMGEEPSWSPLRGEKFEDICIEANLLAMHLERAIDKPVTEVSKSTADQPVAKEKFEEDSKAKMSIFSKPTDVISPIKRDTFCVQDSPMHKLPPTIQQRMLKTNGAHGLAKPCLSTSSPVSQAKAQQLMALRGKAILTSGSRVLPNKPTAPGSNRLSSCAKPAHSDRPRLPQPSKLPSSKTVSRAGSAEDLLSDTASVASDVSYSSLNTSLLSKRRAPATKKAALTGSTWGKPAPLPNKTVVDRRINTSSSSSSVSSINSSLTASPTAKLNCSLNSSMSGRGPSGVSRLPSSALGTARSRRSSVISRASETKATGRLSLSTQGRKDSKPLSKPVKSTPIKKPDPVPTPQQQASARRAVERTNSTTANPTLSALTNSMVKGQPRVKAFVAPTPTSHLKGPHRSEVVSSPDVPRIMKPKRLMSACSVESVAQQPERAAPVGSQTPPAGSIRSLQPKLRRPLALPMPVSRCVTGIPMLTPKSVTHHGKPANQHTEYLPTPARKTSFTTSPAQLKEKQQQQRVPELGTLGREAGEVHDCPAEPQSCSIPFSLDDDCQELTVCEPAEPSSEAQKPSNSSSGFHTLTEQEKTQDQTGTMESKEVAEVLLVDAPAPVIKPEERPLIDLSNTPDLIRMSSAKPCGGQLIDLSSPLIKWSPDDKRENVQSDAPLINLSF